MNAAPSQPDRLVLLGTKGGPAIRKGGPSPTANLLVIGGYPYVIDCGLGVTRGLVEAGLALPELRCIIITHLHSDHVLELGPLIHTAWTAGLKDKVVVHGPSGTAAVWQGFLASLSYDIAIRIEDEGRPDLARMVEIHEYADGVVFADARMKLTALRVQHPPVIDCFALRFDHGAGSVVFSADTTYFPPLAAFARGADILVHEAIYEPGVDRLVARVGNGARLKQHLLASHTLAEDVGRIATEAGVGLLALHHLVPADDPLVTEQHWIEALRSQYHGPLVVGRDGLVLPLTAAASGGA
ncbi:MAG: MBL fold metallo-hydrolase [Roseomonas sp.]|nr:MBL fold metallo-hydrolase [Roseomonas sp.]